MARIIYAGTDSGVQTLESTDGRSWEVTHRSPARGLGEWSVEEVALMPSKPNVVLAGTRGDGVWLSEDFGETWCKPSYGRRGPGKVRCLALDPRDERRVFAGCEPIDVMVSEDLGKSWQALDTIWDQPSVPRISYPVAVVEPHVRDITIDPAHPNTMYVALQVGAMLKSSDGGTTWQLLDRGIDADVHTIAIDPADPNHVLIATGGHDYRLGKAPGRALYSSADGGQSWSPVAMEFSQEYSIPLTLHPKQPGVAYSAVANGQPGQWRRPTGPEALMIRSQDGGRTWQAMDLGGVPEAKGHFAAAIAVDSEDPERVYVALEDGELIGSQDGGDSWAKLGVKIPGINDIKCVSA
jgi:photosystem II stability/assembly factor-like uncharacterized protein